MRLLTVILVTWFGLLGCFTMATATANEQGSGSSDGGAHLAFSSDPEDPGTLLNGIEERRTQRESLLPVSPLKWLHDGTGLASDGIYEATHIRLGMTFNHLFQWASDVLPDTDDYGTDTDMDFVAAWDLINRGKPTLGQLYFHVEGRYDYGTTGPQTIGFSNVAAAGGTANAFSKYDPTFLIRNLYWQQGGPKTKWAYRIGKITTDSILATSQHISPVTTFLPNAGTGLFVSGYCDSGLGLVGAWHFNERFKILGLVADSNGDRYDFGDISEGDFYTAVELGFKIAPRTEKAGFSKITVWHTDGTEDGTPINANTGLDGSGVSVKLELELTDDGQAVGVIRWGKSFDGAAIYDNQAAAHLLFYDPFGTVGLKNDVIGFAANWVDSTFDGTREEYNLEVFYRFPLFPGLDTRLSYQYVIDPAFTREFDSASVFSLGFRTVF
jgi:porin